MKITTDIEQIYKTLSVIQHWFCQYTAIFSDHLPTHRQLASIELHIYCFVQYQDCFCNSHPASQASP